MKKEAKNRLIKIIITIAIFWFADFLMHYSGVGETNYYYFSKLANSILFAFLFFSLFNYKSYLKKLIYSVVFGSWISFYYLISSYSGAVQQFFEIAARYTPPPFVIFGVFLSPYLWWVFHILGFYAGLILADLIIKTKEK